MTDVFPKRKGININRTIVWNDGRVSRATGKRMVQTSCPNASIVRSTVFPLSTRYDREFFGDSNSLLQVAVYVALTLFLQLKKFVQRINNGRRTTVSKCWVYLGTNKASTRRYSRSWETRPFSLFPLLSPLFLSFSLFLSLCRPGFVSSRFPLATCTNSSNFKWFHDTLWKERAAHSQRDKSSLLCFSTIARLGPTSSFVRSHLLCLHYLIAFAFTFIILRDLIIAISILSV